MAKVNMTRVYKCSKDDVWKLITNKKEYKWRSELSKLEVIDDKNYVEYDKKNLKTLCTITKEDKYKEYGFDLKNEDYKASFKITFSEFEGDAIFINATMEGSADKFMKKLSLKGILNKYVTNYVIDIEKELNKR